MAWNPYTDQKNRAYSGILTALFPEQTKTLPRVIVWSVIFLADLILVFGLGYEYGLLDGFSKLYTTLLGFAAVALFWLQGRLWYTLARLFAKKEETWL